MQIDLPRLDLAFAKDREGYYRVTTAPGLNQDIELRHAAALANIRTAARAGRVTVKNYYEGYADALSSLLVA